MSPTFAITSAIPGRVRVSLINPVRRKERLKRWADWLLTEESFQHIDVVPNAGCLVIRYDAGRHTLPTVLEQIEVTAARAERLNPPKERSLAVLKSDHRVLDKRYSTNGSNGSLSHVLAKDLRTESPLNLRNMIFPTIAAALAAVEIVPAAVVIAAIALSVRPSALRALKDAKARRFTIDELDLINVALLVVDGSYLPAAAISWLTNLGELIRARTTQKSTARHYASRRIVAENWGQTKGGSVKLLLENALLTDTQFQGVNIRFHVGATLPFFGLAGLISLTTQDLGFIVGLLKPLYDFSVALRFGIPAILLNAMSHTAKHGPVFRSASSVEKLSKVDAIVFFNTDGFKNNKVFHKRIKQLVNRGIDHFLLPTADVAAQVESIALSLGKNFVTAEPIPADPEHAVSVLHRHGHTVAVVEDGSHPETWLRRADVRIGLPGSRVDSAQIDIVVVHSDLRGIGHTIDLARHSMTLARQNVTVSATAALINLALAVVPPLAASTVSTVATGILAANINRELVVNQEDAVEAEMYEPDDPEVQQATGPN